MFRFARALRAAAKQGPFDPYKILGVAPNANKKEIKQAYHRLALRFHPDSGPEGNAERFSAVNEAYEAVKDGKWTPSAEQQQKEAAPDAYGWDPKRRTYTYEEPGSTTEAYVQGDTAAKLRLFMVACFVFIFVRLFFFFAYPKAKHAVNVPGEDGTLVNGNVHSNEDGNDEPLVIPAHLEKRYYGDDGPHASTPAMVDPLQHKNRY